MKNCEFENLRDALVRHSAENGTAPSCIPCPRQGTEWITLVRSYNVEYRVLYLLKEPLLSRCFLTAAPDSHLLTATHTIYPKLSTGQESENGRTIYVRIVYCVRNVHPILTVAENE